jgi:hypothetical protein
MSGVSYARTDGSDVLPATWEEVKRSKRISHDEILDPARRTQYDAATEEQKREFDRLTAMEKWQPPDDMRFARAVGWEDESRYPGAVPEAQGAVANGALMGISPEEAVRKLGIKDVGVLAKELANFSGSVTLTEIPAGTTIYRTVGLMVKEYALKDGLVTNRLLGEYFEIASPDGYENIIVFYQQTAVRPEWNGDVYHIALTLGKPIFALMGKVAMQKIFPGSDKVLPGGAMQYYIHGLTDAHLADPISEKILRDILIRTRFKGEEQT